MKAASLLAEIAARCVVLPPCYRSSGAQEYVRRGLSIPEELLPGRYVQGLPPEEREALRQMLSSGPQPGRWFVQFIVG